MSELIDLQHDTHAAAPKQRADAALDANRIEEIRERYARGFYDSPAVLEEVARRLLARGAA